MHCLFFHRKLFCVCNVSHVTRISEKYIITEEIRNGIRCVIKGLCLISEIYVQHKLSWFSFLCCAGYAIVYRWVINYPRKVETTSKLHNFVSK